MSMKNVLTYKGAVMTWECDSNGHMNVMYYINKYEHAGRGFSLQMGFTKEYLEEQNLGMVVLEQNVKYLKEVFEDDLLYIESSLIGIRNKAFTVFHQMYNAQTGECVSTMKTALVLFDKTTRKATRFPEKIRSRLVDHR